MKKIFIPHSEFRTPHLAALSGCAKV
jgi:hypothetical protein